MSVALLFIDIESLGVTTGSAIWEVAAARVEDSRLQGTMSTFVKHDPSAIDPDLPSSFQVDYRKRYDPETAQHPKKVLDTITRYAEGRAIVCGSNPGFDMRMLEALAAAHDVYVQETGNVAGYGSITLPEGHTWKSFTNLLLASLPKPVREHYIQRFRAFIKGWQGRGYREIPDEAPLVLEQKQWAPSWRRMAKVLLRNDYWCKGLGQAQPKSVAYTYYRDIKAARKRREAEETQERRAIQSVQETLEIAL